MCFTIHLLTQSLFSLKSSKPVASTSLITHRDPSAHWISNLEWTVLIPPTQESRHAAISVANSYNEVKSPYKISGLQQHKIRKTNIYLLRYYYYHYHHHHHHHRIPHFSALAGKYSPILGFSNQQN